VDPNRRKGEFVLIVEGADGGEAADTGSAQRTLAILLDALPLKQAVGVAAKIAGGKRNELYKLALAMKKKRDS
jgi:16S rRNA (cytidine1402-2'-O)-methyltransferase